MKKVYSILPAIFVAATLAIVIVAVTKLNSVPVKIMPDQVLRLKVITPAFKDTSITFIKVPYRYFRIKK